MKGVKKLQINQQGEIRPPDNVHTLILVICEYVNLHSKSDLTNTFNVMEFEVGDYLGLSRWSS